MTGKKTGKQPRNAQNAPDEMNGKRRKILLFKLGALGDALMTTPLIRQLRKRMPDAKIDYFLGSHAAAALEGNPYLDEIIPFDEKAFTKKKTFLLLKLIKQIRERKYDTIILLDKHWIFNLMGFMSHIPERIGFDRLGKEGMLLSKKVYYGNDKHEIFYYLDLLTAFGKRPDMNDWRMDIFLGKKDRAFAKRALEKINKMDKTRKKGMKIIGLAPGGGKNPGESTELRNWPVDKYASLAEKLSKDNIVILFGIKDDLERERIIISRCRNRERRKNIISFIGKCSFKQSCALMERCSWIVCNDTGSMHMAAAVNKNVISIFGPTNPKRKAPLWKESVALWKDKGLYEGVYELFGTKPKKQASLFMRSISVDDVLRMIR